MESTPTTPARKRMAKVRLNLPMTAKAGHAVYAIKVGSDPVYYANSVVMSACEFVIDQRLLRAFEAAPNRRTVHAHVKGYIDSVNDARRIGGRVVRCNPFVYNCFVDVATQQKALTATHCVLHVDGAIEASDVATDPAAAVAANLATD